MKENTITAKAIEDIRGLGKLFVFPKAMLYLMFFLLSWNVGYGQSIIYVSPNGTGDGSSWDEASNLADAIDNASAEDEIWLMQGVYEIEETLEIGFGQSGIGLFGGFEGTETALNQRDWQNNTTILDGQTTVKIMRVSANNSILDGITFMDGFITGTIASGINDGGGALRLGGYNTLIINCTFRDNLSEAERGGGAIFMWHGRGHTIDNCVFEDNSNVRSSGNGGGAIHNWDRDVTIRNTRFTNNFSTIAGGAVYTWSDNVTIEDCVFENNQSVGSGGALHTSSELTLSNSTFIENSSSQTGGAIYNGGELNLNSIAFTANVANGGGGAIYNNDELSVSNSLFHRNTTAAVGGAIYNREELYVTNSTFVSNTNTAIVHPYQESSAYDTFRTHIFNSIFYNNTAGAINSTDLWPDVDRNRSNEDQDQSETDFRRNIFQENTNGSDNLIGIDPLFQDFSNDDFSLQDNSPAVEYGRNDLYTAVKGNGPGADDDLAGNDRLYGAYIDAGAYELQEEPVETVPNCTTIEGDGEIDVDLLPIITWDAVFNATGYRLTIGTTPTGGEILSNVDVGDSTVYNFADEDEDELEEGTVYYVTVVPYNDEGSATNCTEINFTTETLATVPDCTTITSPTDEATGVSVDTDITWSGVADAEGYYVTIGTTPGGADIADDEDVTGTTYNPTSDFPENTTIYVTVVPYNGERPAIECVGISFTTMARPEPPQAEDQQFCPPATAADLIAEGEGIRWYGQATGGEALSATTLLSSGIYYATQTVGDLESERREVVVTVQAPEAPQFEGDITGCGNLTVADLEDIGVGLRWYGQATGGTALSAETIVSTGTYYASRVSGTCESDRTSVQIVISVTPVPQVPDQSFVPGSTFADLDVTGQNLRWYTEPMGSISFDPQTVISDGVYYVSQTVDGCESDRVIVEIDITYTPIAISFSGASFVYDGTEHRLAISGDLPLEASVDYTNNGRTDVGAHMVTVTVSIPGHETLTLEAELEVTPAPLAIQANSQSKTYGATDPVMTYTHDGLVDGDTEATFTGSLSREIGEEVGDYEIQLGSLSAGSNYVINFVGAIFAIVPAVTTGVSFEDGSFVYDGTEHRLAISGDLPLEASVDYTNNGRTDVGIQTVTATVTAPNYQELVLRAELEIIPAQLNVSADSHTKLYGSSDPHWTYNEEGLIGGDLLHGDLSREPGENVGEYAVLQGTLRAGDNYDMNFVPGRLRIYRGVDAEHIPDAPLEIYGNEQLSIQIQVQNIWTEAYGRDDEVILRLDLGPGLDIVRVVSADLDIVEQNGMWLLLPVHTWDPSAFRHLKITLVGNDAHADFSSLNLHFYNPQNVGERADTSLQLDILVEREIEELVIPNVFTPNGDGINDRFEIMGLRNYDYVRLLVVNQFGVGIYYHENYQNTWAGSGVIDGTYYYILQAYRGWEKREYRGYVLIKRQ